MKKVFKMTSKGDNIIFSINWKAEERRSLKRKSSISVRDFYLYDLNISYKNAIDLCDEKAGRLIDYDFDWLLERHIHNFTKGNKDLAVKFLIMNLKETRFLYPMGYSVRPFFKYKSGTIWESGTL